VVHSETCTEFFRAGLMALFLLASQAQAEFDPDPAEFDIEAQSVAAALLEFARQSEMQLLYRPDDVEGRASPGLQGRFEPFEALSRLLEGTGLEVRQVAEDSAAIVATQPVPSGNAVAAVAAPRYSAAPQRFEEVIVTAARREQAVSELPMSVTVLSGEVLAESWFTDFSELANWVSGVSSRNSDPTRPEYAMRGLVGTSLGGRSVDFLIDGATASNVFYASNPALLDYERVEVIRGAQGTLYGQNSLAGTIKFISVRPRFGEREGDFAASGWTTSNGDDSWRGRATVNLPLGDRVAVRLGASHEDQGGFIDAYSVEPETQLPDELIRENIDYNERTAFRGAIAWQATDRFELYLTARSQSLDAPFPSSEKLLRDPPGGDRLVPFDDYRATPPLLEFDKSPVAEETFATLEAVYEFDSMSLTSETTYYDYDDESAATFVQVIPGGVVLVTDLESAEVQENRSQEIRLTSRQGGRLDWIAGVYWRDESFSQGILSNNQTTGLQLSSNEGTDRTQTSVHGNLRYNATDRFALEAGVRWFNEDVDRYRDTRIRLGDTDLPPSPLDGSGSFETTSPRFAVLYSPNDQASFFAGVSKGFRGGAINLSENLPPELATAEPDSNWSYELGLKGRWLDGRLVADFVAYFNDWEDIQVRVVEMVGEQLASVVVNGESAQTLGFEWQVSWIPMDSLSLSFAGHMMDSELASSVRGEQGPSSTGIREGNELIFAPRWGATLRADWVRPVGANSETYVGLNLMTRDGSYSSLSNEPVSKTPRYSQGNVAVGLRSGSWDVSLFATNAWNERGYVSQQGAFGGLDRVGFGNVILPRRVGLTVRFGF
jgi:outer membrane receptor protein involved in Fe transport